MVTIPIISIIHFKPSNAFILFQTTIKSIVLSWNRLLHHYSWREYKTYSVDTTVNYFNNVWVVVYICIVHDKAKGLPMILIFQIIDLFFNKLIKFAILVPSISKIFTSLFICNFGSLRWHEIDLTYLQLHIPSSSTLKLLILLRSWFQWLNFVPVSSTLKINWVANWWIFNPKKSHSFAKQHFLWFEFVNMLLLELCFTILTVKPSRSFVLKICLHYKDNFDHMMVVGYIGRSRFCLQLLYHIWLNIFHKASCTGSYHLVCLSAQWFSIWCKQSDWLTSCRLRCKERGAYLEDI